MTKHTKKWFLNRVGKRIYRDWHQCCKHCDDIAENGLVVGNKNHAEHLFLMQNEFGCEGIDLNYRDKK